MSDCPIQLMAKCRIAQSIRLATRSIEPSFGLLFGDTLKDLNVGTTGAAVIISALDVCMNFSGLFVGPLLKEFSYRKVAIAGSLLCGLGLALTSPATSMAHILSTYSVINGIGVGLSTSAAFVALNHYFKHKRGQAVGLSMAGTAIGMLIMPQLVRILLEAYDFQGAVLLLAGVALNATVGSVLLQPVKWHMKEEFDDEELMCISALPTPQPQLQLGGGGVAASAASPPDFKVIKEDGNEEDALPEMNTLLFHKHHAHQHSMRKNYSEMAMNTMNGSRLGIPKRPTFPRIMSLAGVQSAAHGAGADGAYTSQAEINATQLRCRKASVTSNLSYMDFTGSILQVHLNTGDDEFEQNDRELRRVGTATGSIVLGGHRDSFIKMKPTELDKQTEAALAAAADEEAKKNKPKKPGFWRRFADLLDIDMLKDKMFLNLLFGLSIFYVAEMNFKMVTPFFFANLGYQKTDVAFCLSITAITDIAARIVLPPIFDRTTIRKRTIFLVSIIFVALTRSIMAEQTDWTQLMIWLSICGFFRGSALSNFTLTVSEYCSLEKLPSAFGWHLVGKALFVISFGPLIGLIRDLTDSYPICIHTQSFCIMLCAFAWGIEYLVEFLNARRRTADAAQVPTQDSAAAGAPTRTTHDVKL
ncbi:GL12986 [Drosophila persimilis]|uniref:GL12986 n=1 Tax=Drosophila persimilis TaxID=7234 RepID=B4GVE0_DROPE|nr:GL12986 [Drosophila persimilis]